MRAVTRGSRPWCAATSARSRPGRGIPRPRRRCTARPWRSRAGSEAAAALRRARTLFGRLGATPDLREIERLDKDVEALQRRSFSHVEALTQAAQRLAAQSNPEALLEDALDEALLLTGAERGFILLHDGEGEPRVAAVRGAAANSTLRISRTVAKRGLRPREMVAGAGIGGSEGPNAC